MKKIYMAACLSLALICLPALSDQARAGKAMPGEADDACFKQVFKKAAGDAIWIVKACKRDGQIGGDNGSETIVVELHDPKTGVQKARLSTSDIDGLVDINYSLLSPVTLLVDLQEERGGTAFLAHPMKGKEDLSSLKFRYLTDDDDVLDIKQNGNVIHAKTAFNNMSFSIDSSGNLHEVPGIASKNGSRRIADPKK